MANNRAASPYALRPLPRYLSMTRDLCLALAIVWPAGWAATGGHPAFILAPAILLFTQRWPEWRSFGPPTRQSYWTMPYPEGQLGNPLYWLAMAYSVAWRFALCGASYVVGAAIAQWWSA